MYDHYLTAWCTRIKQIDSTLDFKMSSRGWCYVLEEYGLAKGDFDKAQDLINGCRKSGHLPIDFTASDSSRAFDCLEKLDENSPDDEAANWIYSLQTAHSQYTPISFWDSQPVYIQLLVEKIDLKSLFTRLCREFRIPVANAKGWSDIDRRAEMMRRFQAAEERGQQPVLLYCGDYDPAGMRISDHLRNNLAELSHAVGWNPSSLVIDRFGLNRDFIDANNLSWIPGLKTGSGEDLASPKHKDHDKAYVQDFIRDAGGARKVEANALVTRPDAGRALFRDTIAKYLPLDAETKYKASLAATRGELKRAIVDRLQQEYGT